MVHGAGISYMLNGSGMVRDYANVTKRNYMSICNIVQDYEHVTKRNNIPKCEIVNSNGHVTKMNNNLKGRGMVRRTSVLVDIMPFKWSACRRGEACS